MQTATNPQTGERVVLINGQWLPFTQSATDDKGQKAFLSNGQWIVAPAMAQFPQEPESFSTLRQIADVPLGIAKGAVQGVRMIADAFGAGSDTSKTIKSAETYLADLMSAQAKNDQQEIARIMKDAEDKGVLDQVKAGIKAFTVAPIDTLSSALGTAAPVIAGALGAKVLGAGALVSTGVSALTGAGMGAGTIKGSIYEETKNALKEAGASEQDAEARAQLAQQYNGKNLDQILLGTVLGGAAAVGPLEKGGAAILARRILGKTGIEGAETVAGQAAKGVVRRRLEAGALEAVPEAIQAGQEQVAQNIALQREGFDVPTFRGAVSAATMEALAGAGLGATVGGGKPVEKPAEEKPATETTAAPEEEVPSAAEEPVAEAPAPEVPPAPTTVTPEFLTELGIKPTAAVARRIKGKSLDDPEVVTELETYATKYATEEAKPKILEFVQSLKPPVEAPVEEPGTPPVAETPVAEVPPVEPAAEAPAAPVAPPVAAVEPSVAEDSELVTPAPVVEAAAPVEPVSETSVGGREQISVPELVAESQLVGTNASGEKLYENKRGRFRVRLDSPKKYGKDGYADFGGDLAPVEQAPAAPTVEAAAPTPSAQERKSLGGKRSELGLYSELEKKIEAGSNKAPAASWKAYINGLIQKGVKPEEIESSGVKDWLDLQQGAVTKEALVNYLKQGGVKVEEVVLGAGQMPRLPEGWRVEPTDNYDGFGSAGFVVRNEDGDEVGAGETEQVAMREAADPDELPGTVDTKYGQYTLPGGNNYREVLLTLPGGTLGADATRLADLNRLIDGKTAGYDALSEDERRAVRAEIKALRDERAAIEGRKANYKSNHWEQPNVLAHIRLNDRTDADGKRVLFVEELQSDWGQQGKKEGFGRESMSDDRLRQLIMEADPDADVDGLPRSVLLELAANVGVEGGPIPTAPFVTKTEGWLNLALKRIMVMAAEGGYDKVAFVNGEQSAERYDLSKQISKIRYLTGSSTGRDLLVATDKAGNSVLNKPISDPKEIEEYVGKEVANRLLNAKSNGEVYHNDRIYNEQSLSGLDLKVGGEGMKTFYNTIVPTALKKLLPKVGGGQMGEVTIVLNDNVRSRVAGFDVTPAMREKVETTGLPMFSKAGERSEQVQAFEQTLRSLLNKFGLKDVGLKILDGMTDSGSYAAQIIRIAADAANPVRTLRHEAIHALRELGFFTDAQWSSLSKMAKDKWIDQYLKQRNVDGKPLKAGEESRYDAYMREYNGDMEKITEEAVSDAFADFDATKPPAGLIQALLKRMKDLFQSIKSALTKVESPEQIFGKVEKGELRGTKTKIDAVTKQSLGGKFGASESKFLKALALQQEFNRDPAAWFQSRINAIFTQLEKIGITALENYQEYDAPIFFNENGDEVPINLLPKDAKELAQKFKKLLKQYSDAESGYPPKLFPLDLDPDTEVMPKSDRQKVTDLLMKGLRGELPMEPDIRKSLGGRNPGEQAISIVNSLGMGVKPPEPGRAEKAMKMLKDAGENPSLTKESAKKTLTKWLDWFETTVFSSDSAFNNKIRRGIISDFKQNPEVLGMLLEASQSQTVHADALASQFMIDGGLQYNEELKKWESVKKDDNFVALAKKIEDLAKKYNVTKDEMERIAHTYFVAKRLPGIIKRNEELDAEIKAERATAKPDRKQIEEWESLKVDVSDEQLAMMEPGLSLVKTIPELKEVVDIWQGIRKNNIDVMVNSGLWSPEYATAMWDNMDYVPYYREEQLEEGAGPQEFIRGLQVKSKEFKLKGSSAPVNDVFDNMIRWSQYAMNRAIRAHKATQMIDAALKIEVDGKPMATKVTEQKRGMNIVRVFRDGKQELYDMADPLFVNAFASIPNVSIPIVTWMSKISNVLRQSVVLYPLFSVAQVPQDSFAAMFSSGLKTQHALKIPYLAVKEFIKTLSKTSQTHNELTKYGVVGVRDFSATVIRDDAEIYAGLKPPKGGWGKTKEFLEHIAMAADNAVRQAVYEASMQQGLNKSEALEKAFEIINFRRRGTSKMLNVMGQTVPFFYAYLSAQRVAYRVLSGVGISPTERKEALTTLATTSAAVAALSMLYAMAVGDDEDYAETPAAIRDRTLTIPGSGGVRIPLRPDFFLFPKIVAEHTYLMLSDKGFEDGAKFRKSMADALLSAVASPTPFPTAIKPVIEVAINYDFFQGKPLIGNFEKQKDIERQFRDSTSELAKLFGQTGLISPIAADHMIRGMLGSFGGLLLFGTNQFLHSDPDVPRPELSANEMIAALPGTSGLLKRPQESALKNDFYQLRDEVEKAANTFNDIKNRSPEGIQAFLEDEKNAIRVGMAKGVEKINEKLSGIRRRMTIITNMPESQMSADEKAQNIRELRELEREYLRSVNVKELREMAQI